MRPAAVGRAAVSTRLTIPLLAVPGWLLVAPEGKADARKGPFLRLVPLAWGCIPQLKRATRL